MIFLNIKNIVWLLVVLNSLILIVANRINIKNVKNDMLKAVADIVKSCHMNDHSSLLIAGNFDHNDIQLLSDIKPKIIKNSLKLSKQPIENTIESLLLFTDSANNLTKFFMQIDHLPIWSRIKYSIILSQSTMDNNCDEYHDHLHIALHYDMINTIVLCTTSSRQIILYTSNPYVSWAPAPWKINKQQWNHTQSGYIYTALYKPNTVTCGNIFFDKTRRMDNYSGIRVISYVPSEFASQKLFYNYDTSPKKVFDYRIWSFVFSHLRMPLSYTISNDYGTFDELGNSCGVDDYVAHKKFDILFDSRGLAYTKDSVQSSSILGATGITFISHYRSNVSTIVRIINYFRPIIMFFSIMVLGLTIVILKISINESFSTAVIDVFRLFVNGPLLRVPYRPSPRIFIFTILVFVLVMQSILRSKILSFIMAPESNDLETFEDLANHKEYTVYCKQGFDYYLPQEIRARCKLATFYKTLVNETNGVLVWDKYSNIGMAYQYKMHHSKEIIAEHHITYRMRKHLPLAKRVNEIFVRMFEGGLNDYNLEAAKRHVETRNRHLVPNKINKSRTLNLQDLDFAFQTIVFGLILACIMFFIEIKCWKYILPYLNRILGILKCRMKYRYTN